MVFLQTNLSSITSNIAVWRSIGLLDQPRSCEWSCFFHNCFEWESLVNLLRHADISVTITSKKKTLRGLVELMKPAIVERLHDLWPQQDAIEPTVPAAASHTVSWTLIVKTHQNQHRRTNKHPREWDLYDKWRREQDLSDKRIGKVDLADVLDTLITIASIELRAVLS